MAGGVDAVMFSNEFSLPYLTKVRPETTAAMADGRFENLVDPARVRAFMDKVRAIRVAARG